MLKKILYITIILISVLTNAQGRTPETIETDFWFQNNWLFVTKTNYTFNLSCLPIVGIVETLNFETNQFNNTTRVTNTYNQNDIITRVDLELWDQANMQWENLNYITFNYQGENLLTSESFNWENGVWVPDTRSTSNYTVENTVESITEKYITQTQAWQNQSRLVDNYNSQGLLILTTDYVWESEWIAEKQIISEYNSNNLLNLSTVLTRNLDNNVLENSTKTSHTYNNLNYLTEKEEQIWETNQWINNELSTYLRDVNNNVEQSEDFEWSTTVQAYSPRFKTLYTRNSDGLPTLVVNQNYEGAWVNSSQTRNTYPVCSTLSTTSNLLTNTDIKLYPNPAQQLFTVNINTHKNVDMHIFDVNGRAILEQTINAKNKIKNQTIDLSNFSSGIYYVKFKTEANTIIKKLIVN